MCRYMNTTIEHLRSAEEVDPRESAARVDTRQLIASVAKEGQTKFVGVAGSVELPTDRLNVAQRLVPVVIDWKGDLKETVSFLVPCDYLQAGV